MKTCPVCKTALFEDMPVCYGCMYEFGTKPDLERQAAAEATGLAVEDEGMGNPEDEWGSLDAPGAPTVSGCVPFGDSRPAFMRRHADPDEKGAAPSAGAAPWTIRLEMRSDEEPGTTWSMELLPAARRQVGQEGLIRSRKASLA